MVRSAALSWWGAIGSGLFKKMDGDSVFDLAAALAYYTALSLAPLLVILITVVSLLGPDWKQELLLEIQNLVGQQASQAVRMIYESAQQRPQLRGFAGLFGLITLLISGGAIFGQLRSSLNRIFEVKLTDPDKEAENSWLHTSVGFLRSKVFNMGMVLAFVFISIVSLVISSLISLFLRGNQYVIGQMINLFSSILIFMGLFTALFYFLPEQRIPVKIAATSGLVTAILFSIGKSLIGAYIGQSAVGSAYGAAGSMIVLLMWVYYSSLIIFFGAELSFQIYRTKT